MNYDHVTTDTFVREKRRILDVHRDYSVATPQFLERSHLSCAFGSLRGAFQRKENQVWQHYSPKQIDSIIWLEFCYILTKQKQSKRPMFVATTEYEGVTDLLMLCPYAELAACTKSRHANYLVYFWVIKQ